MQAHSHLNDSASLMNLAFINTLGLQVLTQTFKSAAFYIRNIDYLCTWKQPKHFRSYMKEGSSCLAFINGSGLDIMLEQYALAYDSDELRDGFFYLSRKNGKH